MPTRLLPVALLLLTLPRPAGAAPHTHEGFFMRLLVGGGYGTDWASQAERASRYRGNGSTVDFALGGSITERVSLHLDLWTWRTGDPTDVLVAGGVGHIEGDVTERTLAGCGLGATVHLPAPHVYLSSFVGPVENNMSSQTDHWDSGWGVLLRQTAGKEWWILRNWGLGAAVTVDAYAAREQYVQGGPPWFGWRTALNLSATFD
jgi:hypothetical protein